MVSRPRGTDVAECDHVSHLFGTPKTIQLQGADIVFVFTGEAQLRAIALMDQVPKLSRTQCLFKQRVLPETEDEEEAAVSGPEGSEEMLLTLSTDLNGIGDELSSLLLLQTGHFLQLDGNCGLPAEDVAVETDPVLREVEAALEEDLPLQGAGVIHDEALCFRKFAEQFPEVLVALFVCGTQHL